MALVTQYNLNEVYTRYFGSVSRVTPFPVKSGREPGKDVGKYDVAEGSESGSESEKYNLKPEERILQQLKSETGVTVFVQCTIDNHQLPNEPTLEISGAKAIVKTEVAGRDGEVKENMGLKDWTITIRGIAFNESGDGYPTAQVKALRELIMKKTSLEIKCWFTQLFGIRQIVIEDWSFPEMEGYQNAQAYRFTCSSDEPISLKLRKLKKR